ncbi:hypothetical protein M0805_000967 [Coniferiporia weirii]|nr:hypothetical protein M0805_000967 [Coniferiporia weirii]
MNAGIYLSSNFTDVYASWAPHAGIDNPSAIDLWSPTINVPYGSGHPVSSGSVIAAATDPYGIKNTRSYSLSTNVGERDWPSRGAQRPQEWENDSGGSRNSMLSTPIDDPAFSGNPYHHPDHTSVVPLVSTPANTARTSVLDVTQDAPPPYEMLVSPDNSNRRRFQEDNFILTPTLMGDSSTRDTRRSGHIREKAQISGSSLESPLSRSSTYSSQGDQEDHEEELLAYLRDDASDDTNEHGLLERNIPMSLRPHTSRPVISQSREGFQAGPVDGIHEPTLPPEMRRTVSGPSTSTSIERPRPPQRGSTMSPRRSTRPTDLDRIDELDESTPLGIPIHHRGPYEVQGKVDTPLTHNIPIQREEQPVWNRRVIIADTFDVSLPPVPFKLDLKPGEYLTRLPPPRSSSGMSTFRPPLAPITHIPSVIPQPGRRDPRRTSSGETGARTVYHNNSYHEWSPEQLYEMGTSSSTRIASNEPRHAYDTDSRNGSSISSSTNTLRSHLDGFPAAFVPIRHSYAAVDESLRSARHITFRPPALPTQLSDRPSYAPSASLSVNSYSSSLQSRQSEPPSSADRLRPKKIVMPMPLHQQRYPFAGSILDSPNHKAVNNLSGAQPAAANIPMHDPKKGNLLKKRASTGTSLQKQHQYSSLHPSGHINSSDNVSGGFGSIARKASLMESALKEFKPSRKLSKRKTTI